MEDGAPTCRKRVRMISYKYFNFTSFFNVFIVFPIFNNVGVGQIFCCTKNTFSSFFSGRMQHSVSFTLLYPCLGLGLRIIALYFRILLRAIIIRRETFTTEFWVLYWVSPIIIYFCKTNL